MVKSLFHWKVLLNVLLAAAVFAGLVWLTFRWLELHTHHGSEIAVPNVMNKSVHDAINILEDTGLNYEVDSFKFDPRYKPFQVLQIYPSPGSHVKEGRTIILKVNPRTWAKVAVPDILDRYKGLAFRQLDLLGLKVGDTLYEPNIQRDAVIRMQLNGNTLKPGTLLPKFSVIDLVIGAGPKRNITIPNLVGLTVGEAKAVIAQNMFETGLIEHEDGGSDDSDIIYYQDPAGGEIRDQGMQIDLWASKKTPSQMSSKIAQLNAVYRIQIDTTRPAIPAESPVAVPISPAPERDQQAVPKPKPRPAEKKEAPKSQKPDAAKPQESKPAETKPKVKKVVVE